MLLLNELPELQDRTIVLVLPLLFGSPRCLSFYAVNSILNLTLISATNSGSCIEQGMRLSYELELVHYFKFACLFSGLPETDYHLIPH